MTDDLEIRRKRMIYRANYRGFKEADLLLGGFAKAYGPNFTSDEITEYESMMENNDHLIYGWIKGTTPIPAQYDTPLFKKLCDYKPEI